MANAKNLNAGFVLNEMNVDERVGYISGVIEGLAYSRFLRDKPSEEGMSCVYRWYDNGGASQMKKIRAWFARHPDKPVGVLLYVLIKKKCGAYLEPKIEGPLLKEHHPAIYFLCIIMIFPGLVRRLKLFSYD